MGDNRCVICWAVIPEGRQYCPRCWERIMKHEYGDRSGVAAELPESGTEKQAGNRSAIGRVLSWLALRFRRGG